tara:strand:+ start:319 stop:543 length:225 start_codon:yes stop_codon:yes gene_type:complete
MKKVELLRMLTMRRRKPVILVVRRGHVVPVSEGEENLDPVWKFTIFGVARMRFTTEEFPSFFAHIPQVESTCRD